MEMTKKEYIGKLKKELDTIEKRYQHLLNENAMIGEDFRSQALANISYADTLKQQIAELKVLCGKADGARDSKDMELVVMERAKETCQMESEELLTRFDKIRTERDNLENRLYR